MTKKVLLTFLVIWLFSNTGSAQILKNTWIINPQLSGFNLGSTHTEDTGKETFDLGLKVEAGNFIANNLAILVGIGGDFAWNKEYKDNSIDIMGSIRYYTLTTLFLGVTQDTPMHGINPKEVILNAEITYMSEPSWDMRFS